MRKLRALYCPAVLILTLICVPRLGHASDLRAYDPASHADFSTTVTAGGQLLPIRGKGDFRYLRMHLYSAAFYAEPSVDTPEEALKDSPKMLVIRYHKDIDKKHILRAAEKNLDNDTVVPVRTIRDRLKTLSSHFVSVKKGDEYRLVYENRMTYLFYNGALLAKIPGADFGAAYFGIWLSKDPISGKLRDALLGKRK